MRALRLCAVACAFAVLPAVLSFADPDADPVVELDGSDVWPMQEGWSILMEEDGGRRSSYYLLESIEPTAEGDVYTFLTIDWGLMLSPDRMYYLRGNDGDIHFLGAESLITGGAYTFDPPQLYLDLPLHDGKTWESRSQLFLSDEPDSSVFEHHRFSVRIEDVTTPLGTFTTFRTSDDPVAGASVGGDHYLPGFGPVAYESESTGRVRRITGDGARGFDPRLQWGRPVTFAFGWRPGMAWQVARKVYISEERDGRDNVVRSQFTYDYGVERLPTGLLIERGNFQVDALPPDVELTDKEQALLDLLPKIRSHIVVDNAGAFQSLAAKERMDDTARELMDAVMNTDDSEDTALLRQLVASWQQILDPQLLEQLALNEWSSLIGAWADKTYVVGDLTHLTLPLQHPLYPDRQLQAGAAIAVTGRCPCEEGDEDYGCVEVYMGTATIPGEQAPHLTMRGAIRVVMDPHGMLPRSMRMMEFLDATDDPRYGTFSRFSVDELEFSYTGSVELPAAGR